MIPLYQRKARRAHLGNYDPLVMETYELQSFHIFISFHRTFI